MKIEYIYSACIVITTDDCKILCDPWFTQGAFGGTWYHFPYKKVEPQNIGFCDYIYVSHIHPDHYDYAWLKDYLNIYSDSKVITANWFRSNPLFMKMKRDGIVNHEVDELDNKSTNIKIFPHDNGSVSDIDSALVVTSPNGQIVNMNDCIWDKNFYDKVEKFCREKNVSNSFKVGLFSYTSAGPYPHTYWYGTDELNEKSEMHKGKFLDHYKNKIKSIQCDINIPFAGQFLLGGDSSIYNDFRGICDAVEVLEIDSKALVLKEYGQGYVDLNKKKAFGVRNKLFDINEIKKSIEIISKFKPDYEKKISQLVAAEIRLKSLLDISFKKAFQRLNSKIQYLYFLNIDNKEFYTLDLFEGSITQGKNIKNDSDFVIHEIFIKRNLLVSLLLGLEHWDNAEKGSMYRSHRNPDKFIRKAQSFLHFFCI